MPIKIGINLGKKIKVIKLIAGGGRSLIYEAFDRTLSRKVVVKALPFNAIHEKRIAKAFIDEAKSISRLSHPNVVKIYGVDQTKDGQPYFVVDYYEESLKRRICNDNNMPAPGPGLLAVTEVLEGLDHAHSQGIIHRDLKPENIMFDADGQAVIIDFGVSLQTINTITDERIITGTPAYMSPEQCCGKCADRRSDIYSVGAILYEIFSGRPLFSSETFAGMIYKHIHEAPDFSSLKAVAGYEGIIEIIKKAVAKDPAARFQSAREFSDAIRKAIPAAGSARTVINLKKPDEKKYTPQPSQAEVKKNGKNDNSLNYAIFLGCLVLACASFFILSTNFRSGRMKTEVIQQPERLSSKTEVVKPSNNSLVKPATGAPSAVDPKTSYNSVAVSNSASSGIEVLDVPLPVKTPAVSAAVVSEGDDGEVKNIKFDSSVYLTMRRISKGEFEMGSGLGDGDEMPKHRVSCLIDFYIGKYEVTIDQWNSVMMKQTDDYSGDKSSQNDNLPKCNVSWDDCQRFLKVLNKKITAHGKFRLPTESEWEYACRAGSVTRYSWGDTMNDKYCRYKNNSGGAAKCGPVGQLNPNSWGLYDMSGNLNEWCQDSYDVYTINDSDLKTTAAVVQEGNPFKVLRGGCFNSEADACRSSKRFKAKKSSGNETTGFRIVLEPYIK